MTTPVTGYPRVLEREPVDTVLSLIQRSVDAYPNCTALRHGEEQLTYTGMMGLASSTAAAWQAQGLQEGERILCALPSGLQLPLAWLATMLCNAVIIPIDPEWPSCRLRDVLSSAGARYVIEGAGNDFGQKHGLASLIIAERVDANQFFAMRSPQPHDLLYGFFTSGSSGVPKCALNHHAGLVNRFLYMSKRFGEGHVVYQNSAPLFDSSIWQMLWPLTSGGTAILPSGGRWSLDTVVAHIERYEVSMTDFVPTLFKLLVHELDHGFLPAERLGSLRNLLIGGEAIDPVSVHNFRRYLPNCRITNTYGHTEASIGMVFHEVCDADGDDIPLGSPIDNTYVRIVDEHLQPVPAGMRGEIIVAGVCVGAGYLNASEQTRRAFLPNPFSDLPGAHVYRTGDYGRVREDGLLEYAGRADDQVKIRGVRIELGEIASALKFALDEVTDAVALVFKTSPDDAGVGLAYVAGRPLEVALIRQVMRARLPASHCPQVFIHYEAFPISANGKMNRLRILEDLSAGCSARTLSCPEVGLERILSVYQEILMSPDLTADSDFFDAGGDSLSAVALSQRLKRTLHCDLTVDWIYQHPTPRRLAAALSAGGAATQSALPMPALAIRPPGQPAAQSQTLLMTGATGFIGLHLLDRILATTSLSIFVLMRGNCMEKAWTRLQKLYGGAFSGESLPAERVRVVTGDLEQPRLGLDEADWKTLAEQVDEVIHGGAAVNFLSQTDQLFRANVEGTASIIRFCCEGRAKRLHHLSSLAAKLDVGSQQIAGQPGPGGYGHTKYLADQLVLQAQGLGLSAVIYRLDDVLPSARSGYAHKESLLHRLILQCVQLGIAPQGCGSVGLLPVDELSDWLCSFVGGAEKFSAAPPLMDVIGTRFVQFADLVLHIGQHLGRSMEIVSYNNLLERLEGCETQEAWLIESLLPSPESGKVPFTKVPTITAGRPRELQNPYHPSGALADLSQYIESLRDARHASALAQAEIVQLTA